MNLSDSDQIAAHLALHGWVPVLGRVDMVDKLHGSWFGLAKDSKLIYAYKNNDVHSAVIDPAYAVMMGCAWDKIPSNEQIRILAYMESHNIWT